MNIPSLKGILPDKAVQALDKITASVANLSSRFEILARTPLLTKPQADAAYGPATQVKALQVNGSNPLNLSGLPGILAQNQLSGIPFFTSIPTSGPYSQPGTLINLNGILTIVTAPGSGTPAGADAKTINGAAVPLSAIVTATNASRQLILAVLTSAKFWLGNGSGAVAEVSLSGDATMANTGALTLANTAVTPATYGNATNVPQITVDSKGRITAAVNVPIVLSAFSGTATVRNAAGTGTSSFDITNGIITNFTP